MIFYTHNFLLHVNHYFSLTSGVPKELGELTKLKKLVLHNNNLSGYVPDKVCKLANDLYLTQFSVDCAGETALIFCNCCVCHSHESLVHIGGEP